MMQEGQTEARKQIKGSSAAKDTKTKPRLSAKVTGPGRLANFESMH